MASLRASWFAVALAAMVLGGAGCGSGSKGTGSGSGASSGSGGESTGTAGGHPGTGGGSGTGGASSSTSSSSSTGSSSTGSSSTGSSSSGTTCTNMCTAGAYQCSGAEIEQCETQGNGCLGWSAPGQCPTGNTCVGNACVLGCANMCLAGAVQCNMSELQTCALQTSGCTDWNAPVACPGTETCSAAACVTTCSNQCTAGTTQCAGAEVQSCALQTNGCTDWNPATSCPGGDTCTGGQCGASTCTNACTTGATQCSAGEQQTCALQTSGCTGWNAATACPAGESCTGTACTVTACTPGTLQCNGTLLQVCNASQMWQTQQVCAQTCDPVAKACSEAVTCVAAAQRCTGNVVEECNSTGTAWLAVENCAVGCTSGLCTGACTPAATRCNGMTPETCNAVGTAWTPGTACTTYCVAGGCAQGGLTINANANATLDGEVWIDGDVVIENSGKLTSPTGNLIIHANNVTVDATSQIVIASTGNDARGKGGAQTSSCNVGPCTATNGGAASATGGSYGAAGTTTVGSQGYCYYSGYYYCTPTSIAPPAYAIADDEAAAGAAGGNCTGGVPGFGGGLLAIYADTITIQGTITANGQAGTGCAGGGSGGGVVLRADANLAFTGSISVAGGAGGSGSGGNGAVGVAKLLYGNANTLTGSVVGQKFASFMPPYDVSSSSHPDKTHWYNDNFTVFELAWSKPFTNSAGYYYNLNTTYGFVPAPANSLFLATEAELYQPSALVAGTNDFHVDTLGPFSTLGTVEHRFQVNINSTPPTIASSSHPVQTTWYANSSPYFTWTIPHATTDVVNFFWVFDPYATTIPDQTTNAIPMDLAMPQNSEQLLLPNQANGIWFFHLITQDTMGYLTKAAATFRVQIGTTPGQGSVAGSITDASNGNAPLAGVTVTLNRGVQTVTSTASGTYAFPSTVYAQQYEVRASKTGYKDGVQMVTVTTGVTATANFAMSP